MPLSVVRGLRDRDGEPATETDTRGKLVGRQDLELVAAPTGTPHTPRCRVAAARTILHLDGGSEGLWHGAHGREPCLNNVRLGGWLERAALSAQAATWKYTRTVSNHPPKRTHLIWSVLGTPVRKTARVVRRSRIGTMTLYDNQAHTKSNEVEADGVSLPVSRLTPHRR